MATHIETGIKGEAIARQHLMEKGYSILETNWRHSPYELDIIAQIGNDIVFVEVKTRTGTSHGFPEESVTKKKAENLFAAATYYLEEKQLENEIRFDIISILMKGNRTEVLHIEDGIHPYPTY